MVCSFSGKVSYGTRSYVRMYVWCTREDFFGGKPKTWTMLARTMFIFWFGAYCRAFNCNESLKNYVMHISIMLRIHIYDGLLKYLFSKEFCWLKHAHSVIFYLTNWTETDVADQASPHMRPIPLHDERKTRSLTARRSRSTFSWPACSATWAS